MRCALGFRAHSGWAVIAAVAEPLDSPAVLVRRRIETADSRIAGSIQPYHAAEKLPLKAAEAHVARCLESSRVLARQAIGSLVDDLHRQGVSVVGCGALLASGRPLPALPAILAAHPLIHTAEGGFYRQVIVEAAEACGLAIVRIREKELLARAEQSVGPKRSVDKHLADIGRSLGPPWRQDEKFATLGAWIALVECARARRSGASAQRG